MADEVGKIYERMTQANSEIEAVQKTEQGDGLPYKFRSIYGIYQMVHPILARNKIFINPVTLYEKRTVIETEKSYYDKYSKTEKIKKGVEVTTLIKVRYEFTTDDKSHVDAVVCGEGVDFSDKSLNKAYTSAMKNALLQEFTIPADAMDENPTDDNDSEYENPEPTGKPSGKTTTQPKPNTTKPVTQAKVEPPDTKVDGKYKTADDYITRINGGKMSEDDKPIDTLAALQGWQKKHQPEINKMPTETRMSIMKVYQERHDLLKKAESITQDDDSLLPPEAKEKHNPPD